MKHNKVFTGILLSLLGVGLMAHASMVVAQYDFPGDQGVSLPSASTDTDTTSTASGLSLGAGLPTTGGSPSGISIVTGNPVNALFLRNTNNSTEAYAMSAERYITFTITPNETLSFTSLAFEYYRDSETSANQYSLRSSADTYGSTIANGSMTGTGSFTPASIDLSSTLNLQNVSTATTFRLYIWGAGDTGKISRYDNIQLLAIPEPSSVLMLGLGFIFVGVTMRRRSSR
ncbi:PEP-CTERM sorting domain-containing protein [Kiritimatiellota bacterium B12222]|nr:PEP-CTERM sorting domain-containing protein [Kiritimatiellota bacterium B12222]